MAIYLDYAAATPVDSEVAKIMAPYFSDNFFNPSADYAQARAVKSQLNEARAKISYWLGCQPGEITFTAGGTEANNLAISGVMANYPQAEVIYSAIEHESVREPARRFNSTEIPVLPDGRVDMARLKQLISDNTALISIMMANNEIGTVQPIKEIADLIAKVKLERLSRDVKLPLYLHSDACQAANYLDLHVSRLGLDLMTLNGGKIYGPKQSGTLFIRQGVKLIPLVLGGGQENGLRSGTENVASDIGFAAALDKVQSQRDKEATRLRVLRDTFINALENINGCMINGSIRFRLPNNVHASFSGQDNETLLIKLDREGVMAAAGSACSASKEEASHVLKSIGLNDKEARSSIRFSLGRGTTTAEIERTVKIIKAILL